jgi:hypothetical protein
MGPLCNSPEDCRKTFQRATNIMKDVVIVSPEEGATHPTPTAFQ